MPHGQDACRPWHEASVGTEDEAVAEDAGVCVLGRASSWYATVGRRAQQRQCTEAGSRTGTVLGVMGTTRTDLANMFL